MALTDPYTECHTPTDSQQAAGTTTPQLRRFIIAQLQPIVHAIAISLRRPNLRTGRDVSVTIPVCDGTVLIVSLRVAAALPETAADDGTPGLDAGRLRLVMDTIRKNIGEPISVSTLCSAAGLSRSHFSRAFRTSIGQSPHAYIARLRLERAMNLMLDSDVPLSEIALVVGFSDQAHFSNAFRRATGTTPAQWRRSQRTRAAQDESPIEDTAVQSLSGTYR